MRRALLLILFFITGATALGYQFVWARMLANLLGHEMRAVIGVVSAFMAGMALGAWWLGGLIRGSAHPGRWYGALEIFIGLWAAFVVPRYPPLLLAAVIAMGATFPAMARLIQGRNIPALYAANTLGAVIGILTVTWWLVPAAGLRASGLVLGMLNVIVGVAALLISRPTPVVQQENSETHPRWMITIWVTGFLAIGFEILGVWVLAHVMENTVYSFAAALAVYLLGTSLGAAWYQRHGNERWLNDLLGATAIVCLGSIMVMSKAQAIYNTLRNVFGDSDLGVLGAEMILAAAVFLLPTFLMGAIFSLLTQQQEASLSKMLASNTFGGAVAPFVLGVILLPAIGSKWTLVLVSLGYFTVVTRWRWAMPAVAIVMVLLLPELRLVQIPPGGALLVYREGVLGSVAVVTAGDAVGSRMLKVNNRFQMGGTSAAETESRQGHLPLRMLPNARRALFLGLGTGITFGAATFYTNVVADGVELLPEVAELMSAFSPENHYREYQGRLRVYVADARRFVKRSRRDYDVVVGDLFHPARDGAGTLYTREHFEAIRARLTRSGLFCQWLPLHQMDEQMLRVVVRTFLEVFPNARAYLLHWSVDVPVLALINAWPPNADAIANDPKISGGFVAGAEALRKFAGDAPINTDDHQIVTYAAPRFTYQRSATPYGRLLTALAIEPPPTDFLKARNVYLHGLVHETEGHLDQAIDSYIESVRISDTFTMGYSRCISLAAARVKDRPEAARALLERLIEAKPNEKLARDLLERLFPAAQK